MQVGLSKKVLLSIQLESRVLNWRGTFTEKREIALGFRIELACEGTSDLPAR